MANKTERANDARKHKRDTVQPFRSGQLSKEYVDTYGTKHLGGVTDKEAKKAKRVWSDVPGWRGGDTDSPYINSPGGNRLAISAKRYKEIFGHD